MLRYYFPLALAAIFLLTSNCCAQSYHWTRAADVPNIKWHSIDFNPRSQGRTVFAGAANSDGIYRSDDAGQTWVQEINDPDAPITDARQVLCVPSDTNIVLAVTNRLLYRSTNGGLSWHYLSDSFGGADGEVISYHADDDVLYYGQNFALGFWKSFDHGANWVQTGSGQSDSIGLCTIAVSADTPPCILQGTASIGLDPAGIIARSKDEGQDWLIVLHPDTQSVKNAEVPKIVYSNAAPIPHSGKHGVAVATRWLSRSRPMVFTTDNGDTWSAVPVPERHPWALDIDQRSGMLTTPGDAAYPLPLHFLTGYFYTDTTSAPADGMVQETTDAGTSWHSTGFPTSDPRVRQIWVLKYDTTSGRIAVAADSGIYVGTPESNSVKGQPEAETDIQIFPSNGIVTIGAATPLLRVRVVDILGRVLADISPEQLTYRYETSGLPPGAYGIEASTRQGRASTMFSIP